MYACTAPRVSVRPIASSVRRLPAAATRRSTVHLTDRRAAIASGDLGGPSEIPRIMAGVAELRVPLLAEVRRRPELGRGALKTSA
jgi:hypothetical protein